MLKDILGIQKSGSHRKTKIVATLGPTSRSPKTIGELIDAGVNVFRLNFSHGTHDEHFDLLKSIRELSREKNQAIAILQDLAGPKIRISAIEGDFVSVQTGDLLTLKPGKNGNSNTSTLFVEAFDDLNFLKVGHQILMADGLIELIVESATASEASCKVVKGGRIRSRVGIVFPDSHVTLPTTTDKDLKDIAWGIENEVDYIALSFVKDAKDILDIKTLLAKERANSHVIAKIERKLALENIEEIMNVSDGIMIARGDLGLELPLQQVPVIQKLLIEQANNKGIPVIVATQMLQSMVTSARPTRAEVSDVATAVMLGSDAVMLSDETAVGENPVAAVKFLDSIARETEKAFQIESYKLKLRNQDKATVPDSVAYAACAAAIKLDASAIIACTETGTSARLVAKYRPPQPLYAASQNLRTLRRMSLYWGVLTIACKRTYTHKDEIEVALSTIKELNEIPRGSLAVVTGGLSVGAPGSTSVMEIRAID